MTSGYTCIATNFEGCCPEEKSRGTIPSGVGGGPLAPQQRQRSPPEFSSTPLAATVPSSNEWTQRRCRRRRRRRPRRRGVNSVVVEEEEEERADHFRRRGRGQGDGNVRGGAPPGRREVDLIVEKKRKFDKAKRVARRRLRRLLRQLTLPAVAALVLLVAMMEAGAATATSIFGNSDGNNNNNSNNGNGNNNNNVYRYNVCNGLSNQLLYHAASIAIAIEQGREVEIPNHFVVSGVQVSDEAVLPGPANSVPFNVAFDATHFLQSIQTLGIRARFVAFDFSRRQIPCAGMQSLHQADAALVRQVLRAFRPSPGLRRVVDGIESNFGSRAPDAGVCVHHRDGQDWYDHCARWGSIPDGIYRGNCLGVPGRSFLESLEDRGLTADRWVYYCGDHEVPRQLRSSPYDVVSRDDLMDDVAKAAVASLAPEGGASNDGSGGGASSGGGNGGGSSSNVRDLWALIDFYVCNGLEHFIGNSVSTFSAIQIALREGERTYWYNTQSIPLGDIWRAYQIPIVYTYTELSRSEGKNLLQASIASVRRHMPDAKVHVLYHGKKDKAFRLWLARKGAILHQHDPIWRGQIETMRQNGNPDVSHLFLHSGNYFGTWQRIDIPLFVESEYALLLDSDTIVLRPFTLADFGLDMTYAIAMSSEMKPDDRPSNAGVMLMNIPRMRQTYDDFLEFILQHVSNGAKFDHPSPSDQGAYCEFYEKENEVRFLARHFNFKPYWKASDIDVPEPYIVHFHGAKPHDYLKQIMGEGCDAALRVLCEKAMRLPFLCRSIQHFAKATRSVDQVAYCNASFQHDKAKAIFCNEILSVLSLEQNECFDFPHLIRQALHRLPEDLGLPKDKIERQLRRGAMTFYPSTFLFWMVVLVLAFHWHQRKGGFGVRLVGIGSSIVPLLQSAGGKKGRHDR